MAGHIPVDMFGGASCHRLSLRLLAFPDGPGEYVAAGRAGMLMYAAAMSWRLPGILSTGGVVTRTFDGDVLPDTTRSQIRRLPTLI